MDSGTICVYVCVLQIASDDATTDNDAVYRVCMWIINEYIDDIIMDNIAIVVLHAIFF